MKIPSHIAGQLLDRIRGMRGSYIESFRGVAGHRVLEDLAKFCRANETCVVTPGGRDGTVPIDRDRTLILEGRREVWLHIQQYLRLNSEQLYHIYNPYQTETDDG